MEEVEISRAGGGGLAPGDAGGLCLVFVSSVFQDEPPETRWFVDSLLPAILVVTMASRRHRTLLAFGDVTSGLSSSSRSGVLL